MDLSQLAAIEEIKQLKARYFRFVDTKQWAPLTALFTPDASLCFAEIAPEPYTRETGIAMIRDALTDCVSIHHGHMPEIEILATHFAQGIWAMEDVLHWSEAGQASVGRAFTRGWGHYHETYRQTGDGWRIEGLRLTRLRVETRLAPLRIE